MRRGALLAVAAALAGCAVSPRIDYRGLADRPRSDAAVPYALTDTVIAIGTTALPPKDAAIDLRPATAICTADGCTLPLVAIAAPTDFAGDILAIVPRRRGLVSTSVTPTYYTNSLRLRVLTVEARDHRLEAINTLGAIATGVAKLGSGRSVGAVAAAAEPPTAALALPVTIDLAEAKAALAGAQPLPGHPGWRFRAAFADRDPGAAGFVARDRRGDVHGALLTSICRPLRLTLVGGGVEVAVALRVADPDWLVAIPLPAKGALTLHPLCGADVQADKVTAIGVDALVEAAFAQVEAVRAAR